MAFRAQPASRASGFSRLQCCSYRRASRSVFAGGRKRDRTARVIGPTEGGRSAANSEIRRELKRLIGKVGQAKTLMMPSGAVVIDGRTIDALSEGLPIEAGQSVRVVEVRGTRVVVRSTSQAPTPADPGDPLSQPIDSLGLDRSTTPLLDKQVRSGDDHNTVPRRPVKPPRRMIYRGRPA